MLRSACLLLLGFGCTETPGAADGGRGADAARQDAAGETTADGPVVRDAARGTDAAQLIDAAPSDTTPTDASPTIDGSPRTDGPSPDDLADCPSPFVEHARTEFSGRDDRAGLGYRLILCDTAPALANSRRYEARYFEITTPTDAFFVGRDAPFQYENTHHNWRDSLSVQAGDHVLRFRLHASGFDEPPAGSAPVQYFIAIDGVDGESVLAETEIPHNRDATADLVHAYCGEACDVACDGSEECEVFCGADCQPRCAGSDDCRFHVGAGSTIDCGGDGHCYVECEGDCAVGCSAARGCFLGCSPGASCSFTSCPGEVAECLSGLVCNRGCG